MSPKPRFMRSPSPVGLGRSSFSSIRERDSDLAQTFTSSKISSYSSHNLKHLAHEVAVSDEPSTPTSPLSTPSTAGDVIPSDNNMLLLPSQHGAVEFDLKARENDLAQSFARSLAWLNTGSAMESQVDASSVIDLTDTVMNDVEDVKLTKSKQPFETLPIEIFRMIVDHLILDTPPNGIDRRNVDLMSLLVTSSSVHDKTLEALYRRVIVPHSRNFQKFFTQLEAHAPRGEWVRRLDFSHFSPVSLFATASARAAAKNLTAETLLRCLNMTPNLQEFLVQDYLDGDIDENVIRKLLVGLPRLAALDLCGSSSVQFRNAFAAIAASEGPDSTDSTWPQKLGIQRLSLHKCITLPSAVFEFLLPKLNRLTHLDLAGTRVTDEALMSIPTTARISHLNLAKCSLLTADGVINFLTNHPAVNRDTLVFLSLGCDASTFQLLEVEDVSRLLPILPKTLKSLSLKGSKMNESHLPHLREQAAHLEELALGRGLSLDDVGTIVHIGQAPAEEKVDNGHTPLPHELRYLDLSDMDVENFNLASLLIDGLLLGQKTWPLEVIEVSDPVFKRVAKSNTALHRMGWRQSEIGSRSWLVRGSPRPSVTSGRGRSSLPGSVCTRGTFAMENGSRKWKMGAQSWGMRKIPVAHAKVGGMYGSYMFGRKL
ncbi:leucine rich repeat domain containing protein [Sporothrix brasiliensis 5110]|uniref:Leucine rich repeat domain containing protein n=1 Tax=Sporothrix brasiliensis 5110 TaxID=1398154 RepID=A0A0C2J2Y6_9PEZI|nr:leucine rich repeat domain containing protein [Sporothrix brasiliensis 5110]KIH91427.1 leucine rich repeat domain containing protein [Sporothrix brasiliensis 5110]